MTKQISVKYDMYHIQDRLLEGVMVKLVFDVDLSKVKSAKTEEQLYQSWSLISKDYLAESDRKYVRGLGAPGTDQYYLDQVSASDDDVVESIFEELEKLGVEIPDVWESSPKQESTPAVVIRANNLLNELLK